MPTLDELLGHASPIEASAAPKPIGLGAQVASGFGRSFQELPGMLAGVGAFAADAVGADSARDSMLSYAKRKQDEVGAAHAGDAQSITDAWDGKAGWLDFLANSAGYVTGQALQAVLSGGMGSIGAKMLAKQGLREYAETAATKAAATAIAGGATEEAAGAVATKALRDAILTRGAVAGAGAHNFGMELGSIYPDAVEQSEKDGKGGKQDAGDLFRVIAAASVAAGVDTLGEAITARRMFKGSKVGAGAEKAPTLFGSEIAARAAREVPAGMAREAGTEAIQTGIEQYGAAKPYDLKEIVDSAGVGAVGGALGGAVSSRKAAPKKDAADVLAEPTVDDAIGNAMLAIAGPVSKPAWEVVDGLALPGPAQPAQPTMLRSLPAPDGQTVYMADERGNVAPQPAEARTEALNRQFDAGQQADAAARATDELSSTLGITPGLRAAQQQRALRDAEGNLIPVGEATELPNIPVGDATPIESIPTGEASELVPTGEATELPKRIPVGKAAELDVEVIEPTDILAASGDPFVSKTGAQARAFSTGGRVVPIPDHFGSGKAGYVVRPITEGRPNNTRGTNAADAIRAGGAPTADPGRGDRTAVVPDSRPADVLAGTASPEGQGVAGLGAAGNGAVQRDALTPGQRVTLPNKDGVREAWTVDGQTGNIVRLDNGKGRMRAFQVGSPTWDAIQPEGGAATDQAPNANGDSEAAAGQPAAATSQPTPQADAKPTATAERTQAPAPAVATPNTHPPATKGNADKPGPAKPEAVPATAASKDSLTDTPLSMVERAALVKVAPPAPSRTAHDDRMGQLAADDGAAAEVRAETIKRMTAAGIKPTREVVGQERQPAKDGGGYTSKYQWQLKNSDGTYLELTEAERVGLKAAPATNKESLSVAPPARTEARGKAKHPQTVMGSRILAMVSDRLGGLDPAWISQFSHRQETKGKDKNGLPRIQWRNPLIPGVGKLFRSGGTQDTQLLAEVLEQAGYLPPGSVEADAKEAGETAMQIVRDALNRAEAQTQDEQQAEREAADNADRKAYYAELDAESAREAEIERQAIMADNGLKPADMDALQDDDIPWDAPGMPMAEGMRALGFTEQEIADAVAEDAAKRQAKGGTAQADGRAAEAARAPAEAGAPAPGTAGQAEGLTLTAQTGADLKAKTEREAAGESAAKAKRDAEQARLRKEAEARDLKARADATVDDFQLGQDADRQMSGMGDLFADAPPAPASKGGAQSAPTPDAYKAAIYEGAEALGMKPGADNGTRFIKIGKPGIGKTEHTVSIRFIRDGDRLGAMVSTSFTHIDPVSGREAMAAPAQADPIYKPAADVIAEAKARIDRINAAAQEAQPAPDGETAGPTEAAAPDLFATPEAFDGKTITQQVQVADTGKTATLRMDAGQALRDVNEREQALTKLKACIGR